MMKKIIFFILAFVLFSCSEKKECFNLDIGLSIYLKNSQGENLLNTENYTAENIKIYHKLNNQEVEIYGGFSINNETNPISMSIQLNTSNTESIPTTYIKWNETDTDTIVTSYERGECYFRCNSVWLNGNLVWDRNAPSEFLDRQITIVK